MNILTRLLFKRNEVFYFRSTFSLHHTITPIIQFFYIIFYSFFGYKTEILRPWYTNNVTLFRFFVENKTYSIVIFFAHFEKVPSDISNSRSRTAGNFKMGKYSCKSKPFLESYPYHLIIHMSISILCMTIYRKYWHWLIIWIKVWSKGLHSKYDNINYISCNIYTYEFPWLVSGEKFIFTIIAR